jgi:hypothetical protein
VLSPAAFYLSILTNMKSSGRGQSSNAKKGEMAGKISSCLEFNPALGTWNEPLDSSFFECLILRENRNSKLDKIVYLNHDFQLAFYMGLVGQIVKWLSFEA